MTPLLRITPAVKIILMICFITFLIQQTWDQFFGGHISVLLGLSLQGFLGELKVWQLFTFPFLHGDVLHLFLNLLMLAFIGSELESVWGTRRFLQFSLFSSLASGVSYLCLQAVFLEKELSGLPMVGASGALYGMLVAYGLLFGERVLLFMMLFPMKAKHFIWVLIGLEFMSSVFSGRGGLSSVAHLGGMAGGFIYLWIKAWKIVSDRKKQEALKSQRLKGSHLKLVESPDDKGDKKPGDGSSGSQIWH